MKTYFYASYMLNVNEPDVCAIIKAQSQAQIKRACICMRTGRVLKRIMRHLTISCLMLPH